MSISSSRRRWMTLCAMLSCGASSALTAQEGYKERLRADDIGGVLISIALPESDATIDAGSRTMLANRMGSVLASGGLSGVGVVTPFVMFPRIAVVDDVEASGGLESRTVTKVEVAFVVHHVNSRSSIHQWSGTFVGTGRDRASAVRNAISRLQPSDTRLADFAREVRVRIVQYYEKNCDGIRAQARSAAKSGSPDAGYAELLAVPGEAARCQKAAAADAERLFADAEAAQCERSLRDARSEMASGNLSNAATIAADTPPGTACAKKSDALLSEIDSRARAREDRTTQLRLESIRTERGKSKSSGSDVVSRGKALVPQFFNRTEARTIRLDLFR